MIIEQVLINFEKIWILTKLYCCLSLNSARPLSVEAKNSASAQTCHAGENGLITMLITVGNKRWQTFW